MILTTEKTERELIIEKFISFNYKDDDLNKFIVRVKKYLSKNKDEEIECILSVLNVMQSVYAEKGFKVACVLATPVFEWLESITQWKHLDLHLFIMAIGYHPSFSKTLVLFDKALDTLDDEDSPNYLDAQIIRATMHNNLSIRILRAKFIDSDVPVEILENTFKLCYDFLMPICISQKKPQKYFLEIRRGVFENNVPMITGGLKTLLDMGEKKRYQAVKAEIVELLLYVEDELDTRLKNIIFGHQVRKQRKFINMSSLKLADLLDISQNAVTAIERGDSGASPMRAKRIAQILGVTLGYLYGEITEMPEKQDPYIVKIKALLMNASEEDKKIATDLTEAYLSSRYPNTDKR
ncbi:MAG: helix-turn-helix domain-containing protein [Defluviitaleaceae bacterium]|nr:helix-turn-helix domain-containing protein [Defluviitaleaceae bacterium]